MGTVSPRKWLLGAGLILALSLVLVMGRSSLGEQAIAQDEKGKENYKLTKGYYGVVTCKRCHETGDIVKDIKDPICKCNEYVTWKNKDKHSLANLLLKKPRAQEMG